MDLYYRAREREKEQILHYFLFVVLERACYLHIEVLNNLHARGLQMCVRFGV
jgi:hypothetical protein